jgi:hypothetical protein
MMAHLTYILIEKPLRVLPLSMPMGLHILAYILGQQQTLKTVHPLSPAKLPQHLVLQITLLIATLPGIL